MKSIAVFLCAATLCSAANFVTGQAARALIGQPTFTAQDSVAATVLTLTQVTVTGTTATYSYSSFTGPAPVVGLSVTFSGFNTGANNTTATLTAVSGGNSGTVSVAATGQANETTAAYGISAAAASSGLLGAASGIAYANGKLFVADSNRFGATPDNNRVLVFDTATIPAADAVINPASGRCPVCSTNPKLVLGQADFTKNDRNSVGATSMFEPTAVATDGTRLVVADTNFNRVLIWNSIPNSNQQPADLVLGQPDLNTAAQLGRDSNGVPLSNEKSMRGPQSAWIQGNRLFVADTQNHRILIWNSFPTQNNQAADAVLGFPNLTTNKQGLIPDPSPSSLLNPVSVTSDGVRLYVSDLGNNRVLIWNDVNNLSNNKAADVVIGQPDFSSYYPNNTPALCAASGTTLTLTSVSASASTAIYAYSSYTGPAPVVGQSVVVTGFANAVNNQTVQIISVSGGTNGSFVTVATTQVNETAAAQGVIYPDRCGKTLNFPRFALSDGTRLFIADGGNNRVLVYNTIPTGNAPSPDEVIGQLSDSTDQISASDESTASAADALRTPSSLAWDGTNLYVSDTFNRRILVYTPEDRRLPLTGVRNAASRDVYAIGAVTFGGTIKAGDSVTVTIAGKDYTYKLLTNDTFTSIVQAFVNLINNGSGDPNVLALPNLTLNAVILTARQGGEAGNNITLATSLNPTTSTLTAGASGANLSGGQNAAKIGPYTLVSITGDSLSDATASADLSTGQLPYELGNVQVYFDGMRAPLLYVSPNLINAQMPVEVNDAQSVTAYVRVTHADGTVTVTTPIGVPIVPENPGIFADQGTDPRPAVAQHGSSYATGTVQIDGTPKAGDAPFISIEDRTYTYTATAGDTLNVVRDALINLINSNPAEKVVATAGGSFTRVRLRAKVAGPDGQGIAFSAGAGSTSSIVVTPISTALCCANIAGAPVTTDNPAVPGETITLLATGLGLVKQDAARQAMITGQVYSGPPNSDPNEFVSSLVGGKTANVISAGLQPGTFGLYQIVLELNGDLPTNPFTQATIAQFTYVSNIVTIPIFSPKAPAP